PGSSGAAGSFITYGATSAQNTSDISATNYLFNVGYAATAVEQVALGGLITSTATGTNKNATALTLAATGTGSGTSTALYITNGRLTFTDSDDSHITSFTTGDQAANINYTLPTAAGTNGQVLSTNGSGALSWTTPSSVTSLDGLSDAKSAGTNFTGSLMLGQEPASLGVNAQYNTAVGIGALSSLTTGDNNVALGYNALGSGSTSIESVAIGYRALSAGSSAGRVIAVGPDAGFSCATCAYSVFIGRNAGYSTNAVSDNTVVGNDAFRMNTSGSDNTVVGANAMENQTSGNFNTAVGRFAGVRNTTGSGSVFLGYFAGPTANGVINNSLYIHNGSSDTPLIKGDFGATTLTFNGAITTTGTSALNGDVTLGTAASATGGSIIMNDNSTSDSFTATISLANLSASRAYTIPEVSADASFVMTEGAQTVNGAKTFGSAAVFNTSAKLKSSDGTGGVILQAGAMSNTNVTYTLPTADGSSGQVLQTNGSGTLSWNTPSSVGAINDLTDAVKDITDFTGSMILGHQTTGTLSAAQYNTAVGMTAMDAITSGDENTIVGYGAGSAIESTNGSTLVGYLAGRVATGGANTALGGAALYSLTTGSGNVAVGHGAGYGLTTTDNTIAIGFDAIRRTPSGGATGTSNIAIGWAAMEEGTTGTDNIMIGKTAGRGGANNSSANNVVIGSGAGFALTSGSSNVLIGYQVGNALTTQSNLLYIDNSNTATPLIQGNFSTDALTFNGSTTTTGSVTVAGKSINTAFSGAAKTAGASPGTAIDAFAGTYEKIAITATG
ncbi:MAG: beta strand repeat-containing protein, partial [Ignavibacteria bacterium]